MKNNNTSNTPASSQPRPVDWVTHFLLLICLLLCGVFIVWAYYGTLDIVSMAQGRVVPSSKLTRIQHLEGGIIHEILVREGDGVKSGQPLIILEGINSGASVEELQIRITALQVDIIRLQAMLDGKEELEFPDELQKNASRLVQETRNLFAVQMKRYESELASQKELIKQREQEITTIEARIRNNTHGLDLLEQQIAISTGLLKENLTTEYKHLGFLREESALRSTIEEDASTLKRASSVLNEAREKQDRIRHAFHQQTSEDLKKSRQELDEFTQRLKKFTDSLQRTIIRSPVEGIVKTRYITTIGGVVSPGQNIMDIVPLGDSLVIEAQLPIQDIGHVQPGQTAVVQLASIDARRYGKLQGKVIYISPDAISTSDGKTFYSVHIKTEKDYFGKAGDVYQLIPGMVVSTSIRTGERTVLNYLVSPFLQSMNMALRER